MSAEIDLAPFFTPQAIEEAFQRYKDSKTGLLESDKIKIPMGADGVEWEQFENHLSINSKNISNRVLGGIYYFYPFREVDKPKPDGGIRRISIASIRDALVQRQLYEALYESVEKVFSKPNVSNVSFAYRKGKSAPRAALKIWEAYKDGYLFALDADIVKFFDTLDHSRLSYLIDNWLGTNSPARQLLWRFMRTARVPYDTYRNEQGRSKIFQRKKPKCVSRTAGVPQGGVLSGMLANLYLHEFDLWVVGELGKEIDLKYFRYADDFVILTRDEKAAEAIKEPVRKKLADDLFVELHSDPNKTKISEIAAGDLEFVGFHFTAHDVRARESNIKKFKNRFKEKLRRELIYETEDYDWQTRLDIAISYCVNPRIIGLEQEPCPNCGLPRTGKRNWMAFFSQVVTHEDQLKQLDRWMRAQVSRYFRDNYRVRLGRKELRGAGMKSLVGEYYRLNQKRVTLCACLYEELEVEENEWGEEEL